MVHYSFNTDTEKITNNKSLIASCIESIHSGKIKQIRVGDHRGKKGEPNIHVSCLDFIFDAIQESDMSDTITPFIFESLSHPDIDLNNDYCSIFRNGEQIKTSCIPKLLESYREFLGHTDDTPKLLTALNAIKDIFYRYPELFAKIKCRTHENKLTSCFEKLIVDCGRINFIEPSKLPDGYFDLTSCRNTDIPCYQDIINHATSSGTDYKALNSKDILNKLISSKKYEDSLFIRKDICTHDTGTKNFTCFDYLIDRCGSTATSIDMLINTLKTYSNSEGVLDTQHLNSPFYSKKCRDFSYVSDGERKMQNCIDSLIFRGVENSIHYRSEYRIGGHSLLSTISKQPQFNGLCGSIDFTEKLATSYYNGESNTSAMKEMLNNFAYINKDGKLIKNPFTSLSIQDIDKLKLETCISKITNKPITAFDYALELGSPFKLSLKLLGNNGLLPVISESKCANLKTGVEMGCMDKISSQLIVNPKSTLLSLGLFEQLLYISSNYPEYLKYLYPDNEEYAITNFINNYYDFMGSTEIGNEPLLGTVRSVLDQIPQNVNKFTKGLGRSLSEQKKPSLMKLIELYKSAKYTSTLVDTGSQESNYIKFDTLTNQFSYSESDIPSLLENKLFRQQRFGVYINTISNWWVKFADNKRIHNAISNMLNAYRSDTDQKSLMPVDDRLLFEFYKVYLKDLHDFDKPPETRYKMSENVKMLFKDFYGVSMEEKFAPSAENRKMYDMMCFKHPGYDGRHVDGNHFMRGIYANVDKNSKLRDDKFDITGVYDIKVGGNTGVWGSNHIHQYLLVMDQILFGSDEIVGLPYVKWEKNQHNVPVGLVDAVNRVSDFEPIGKRSDNITGKLQMSTGFFDKGFASNHSVSQAVSTFRSVGSDIPISIYYVNERGEIIQNAPISNFMLMESMQKMPKKLKKNLQTAYPILFGQLDAVIAFEKSPQKEIPEDKTYKVTISNKPVDILRASTCHQFDGVSCMTLFGGGHNESLEYYIDSGSYIAYLTKDSEYEPQWMARMFLHKCSNCKKCVSIQDSHRYYEIDSKDRSFPHWNLLYDAVKVILSNQGVNSQSSMDCDFYWGTDIENDIRENGDSRCDEEMDERMSQCIGDCEETCDDADYSERVSNQVSEEIERRLSEELVRHTDDNGDYTISDREINSIRSDIEDDVHDTFEMELVDELISECKDECEGECENVNDDFDCYDWLVDNGLLDDDEDNNVWTDTTRVQSLRKGNPNYMDILLERTGKQTENSEEFIKFNRKEF